MNKQNTILDFENLLNTYFTKIPKKQLSLLILRKWLPIKKNSKFAEECAYLIGKIMGDGHLDKRFNTIFIGQEKETNDLKDYISNTFNINKNKFSIKFRKAKGVSYRLSVNDNLLGRMLFCLGAPIGNKTKQEFLIPEWILSNKQFKRRYLQALLEDELTTVKIEKCNHSIEPRLKLAKKEELISNLREFMKQIKEAIESFGVRCSQISKPSKGKDKKSIELYFHIKRNKENIIKFAKNIGFRVNKEKIKHLHSCVKVLEKTLFNRKPLINEEKIIVLRNRGLSIREISKVISLNKSSVYRVIEKNKK